MHRSSVDSDRGLINLYAQPLRHWKPILVLLLDGFDEFLAVPVCHDDSELNDSTRRNAPRKHRHTPFHALLIRDDGKSARLLRTLQAPAEERDRPYDSWSLDDFARKLRGPYLIKSTEDALPCRSAR